MKKICFAVLLPAAAVAIKIQSAASFDAAQPSNDNAHFYDTRSPIPEGLLSSTKALEQGHFEGKILITWNELLGLFKNWLTAMNNTEVGIPLSATNTAPAYSSARPNTQSASSPLSPNPQIPPPLVSPNHANQAPSATPFILPPPSTNSPVPKSPVLAAFLKKQPAHNALSATIASTNILREDYDSIITSLLINPGRASLDYTNMALAPAVVFTDYQSGSTTYVDIINTLIGADSFYEQGIYGQNAKVANIESQLFWNKHISLDHVTESENFYVGEGAVSSHGYHATAVAQLIAGLGEEDEDGNWSYFSLGISPLADLYSGSIATATESDGSFSLTVQSFASTYRHYFLENPMDVINSSWGGSNSSTEKYSPLGDWMAAAIDELVAVNTHTTMVVSAGNSGESGGNTVGSPAVGFNVIAVGALSKESGYTAVADFSSYGPSDFYNPATGETITNARATVHLVAPGEEIWGAADTEDPEVTPYLTPEQIGATDLYFTSLTGTSFAAPLVAGGATLLASYSYAVEDVTGVSQADARDARVIKAVLLSSADKISGWSNNSSSQTVETTISLGANITTTQSYDNVLLTTQALDYQSGAGALNLEKALDVYTGQNGGWDLNTVDHNDSVYYLLTISENSNLSVTLTWFAETISSLGIDLENLSEGDFGYLALADLNLEIWTASQNGEAILLDTLLATSRTLYDTVEHLYFSFTTETEIAIRVFYEGKTFDLRDTEDQSNSETYAVAWSITSVPEPSTYALCGGGILLFLTFLRRRKNRS